MLSSSPFSTFHLFLVWPFLKGPSRIAMYKLAKVAEIGPNQFKTILKSLDNLLKKHYQLQKSRKCWKLTLSFVKIDILWTWKMTEQLIFYPKDIWQPWLRTYQSKTLSFWYRARVDCFEGGVAPEKLEICGVDQSQFRRQCYKINFTQND